MARMAHGDMDWKDLFLSRREMLTRMGNGFAALGLAGLLSESAQAEGRSAPRKAANVPPVAANAPHAASLNPLAVKNPPLPGRAKRVIFLFMNGGPSHVDTFDPKPMLAKHDGSAPPDGIKTGRKGGKLMASPFKFAKYGQSGIEVSELFPEVAKRIDDICVIRSMCTDIPNHEPALLMMNSGQIQPTRPSMGSWLTYGLGTENQNLPGYVVL